MRLPSALRRRPAFPALAAFLAFSIGAPFEAAAQATCPGPGSTTKVPITWQPADGSTPTSHVLLVTYFAGTTTQAGQLVDIPVGTTEVEVPLPASGTNSISVEYKAGGNQYLFSPIQGGASCNKIDHEGGGCTVTCTGGATFNLHSTHGSFNGIVVTLPKQKASGVAYRYEDSPDNGGSASAGADGLFQLPRVSGGLNNDSILVIPDGTGSGSRTVYFYVGVNADPWRTRATTTPNGNPFVVVYNQSPYYETPKCPKGAPCDAAGRPVRVTTGEMYFDHADATVGAITFSRNYTSNRLGSGRFGAFGPGWNASFDERLNFPESGVIEARAADGSPTYFVDDNSDGTFEQKYPPDPLTTITLSGGVYTRSHAAGDSATFSSAGRISSMTTAAGVVTTYTRDASFRVTGITELGRTLTITYDALGRPEHLKNGATTLASYFYDAANRLESVRYPDGTGFQYGYDTANRAVFVGDQSGKMIERHDYDAQGRATTSEIDEGREKFTFSYGNGTTTITDALGNATAYDFRIAGGSMVVTKIAGPCFSCGGGGGSLQEFEYDEDGNVLKKRDADSKEWLYTYDANHRMLTETDPLNQTTTYTYDAQGRMLTRTGPDGAITTYVQSPAGPTSITQTVTLAPPVDRTTLIAYHAATGRPQTITDPRGKVTTMGYDPTTGDLLTVTDPLTHVTTFTYDTLGRRTKVKDALNNETTTAYDIRGRVTRITNPDATFTEFFYDASGRRDRVVDPLGRTTRYLYDDFGRLTTVLDPLNQATRYAYDLMGNLLSLTDAKNQTTTFEYDSHYRVKKVIYPAPSGQSGAFETFTYDSRGRLATMVDRKGVTTTYGYDDLSRLTSKTFTNDPANTPAFAYTYDAAGRMLTATNGSDTLTWVYNLAGELLSEQSAANTSTVAYTYDNGGNRLTVSLNGALDVTYGYDDASRLTTLTRAAGGGNPALEFGFGYDNANRRTSMTYPNSVTTSYGYDTLSRLTTLAATHTPSSTPITTFAYQYDAAGNRTQKQTLDFTEDYGYDSLYRLTRADRTNPTPAPPTHWSWSYDGVGNRLTNQKDTEATTSSYNEKNQLLGTQGGGKLLWRGTLDEPGLVDFTSGTINGKPARMLAGNVFETELDLPAGQNTVTIRAQDGSGNIATKNYQVTVTGAPASYTYDANGNLATKTEGADSWTYAWNALNQLVSVTKNGATVASYSYDPLGRRILKVSGGVTTTWLYDGEDIARQTAGGVSTSFTHGPGIDEPLAQTTSSTATTEFLHADALGSVVRHTNSSGAATMTIKYDAWGNIESGTPFHFGFTAREFDSTTSLDHFRYRWYDARAGRFTSEDPLGFQGGTNFLEYSRNTPAVETDPYGLESGNLNQKVPGPGPVPMARWKTRTPDDIYRDAERRAQSTGLKGPHNGPQDAYRHCLASCMMTRETSEFTAWLYGWSNEKRADWGWGRPDAQEAGERRMDDHNNACGRRQGGMASSTQDCEARCMTDLLNNVLTPGYRQGSTKPYGKY